MHRLWITFHRVDRNTTQPTRQGDTMNTAITSKFETIGAAPVVTIAAAGVASGYLSAFPNRPLSHSGHMAQGSGYGYWGGANRPT